MRFSNLQDWLSWQEKLHVQSIDMGLDRIFPVYDKLMNQALAKKTVVVGGTNGKGSTVSFIESMFVSGGYQVGTYSSPHLLRYNERIRINGEPVSDEQLCKAFENVEISRDGISLTYFEFGTLAAFDIFQHQDLDIVILEVGLGGRLDAVNLIDADVAVVTNIQLDHMEWLGETREEIAVEKLGIARNGKPIILADDDFPENVSTILAENKTIFYKLGDAFGYTYQDQSWNWWFDGSADTRQQKHSLPLPSLRGTHQFNNASAALCVSTLLQQELPLSMSHIRVGLNNATLPGRFQLERVEDKMVILDVSHNPHGIQAFIANLKQLPAIGETYIVFAMLKDKAIDQIVTLLDPVIDHWLLAELKVERAIHASSAKQSVEDNANNFISVQTYHSAGDACRQALEKMQPNDKLLVVGSFYTITDAMVFLKTDG